ncbi:hypothetical protein MP228_001914 [Amoeboaphelidium protococcarum]|nr:hypothetical protein MP228_001914 [Amoeboaphelidium protococcarum]
MLRALNKLQARFITTVKQKNNGVLISDPERGLAKEIPYVWLRDNCQCPQCVHPTTKQKLISSGHIPLDMTASRCQLVNYNNKAQNNDGGVLEVQWSQNLLGSSKHTDHPHKSQYPVSWLLQKEKHNPPQSPEYRNILWDRKTLFESTQNRKEICFDYRQYLEDDNTFLKFSQQLQNYGLAFIQNIPSQSNTAGVESVESIAYRIGPIRETFYGKSWKVMSEHQAKNIAYTNLYLGLHMDLMYFESPPGLQFLHCVENRNIDGGESTFVDSYKAVQLLKQKKEEHYHTLSSIRIPYHYHNNGHQMIYWRPVILQSNSWNKPSPFEVNYSPPFMAPLSLQVFKGSQYTLDKWYEAFQHFQSIIEDESMLCSLKLAEGECAVFANRRVLHGRQGFTVGENGMRLLRGTYIDWDIFLDQWRVIKTKKQSQK